MNNNNIIPIVFSSSNEFVPYLCVCLTSLKEHLSNIYNYKIYILENDINSNNKFVVNNIFINTNATVEFINLENFIKEKAFYAHDHVSIHTFFKFFIPKLLPEYNKVLFCDSDIIFKADPAILYNVELGNKKIGASLCHLWNAIIHNNPNSYDYTIHNLKIKNPEKYIQGGILLFNIKTITDKDIQILLDLATHKEFPCLDQDILNMHFQDEVLLFDSKWNYETAQSGFKDFIPNMQEEHFNKWRKAEKDVHIIHYSGKEKPWFYPEEEYANIWWEYARKTPYYETIIKRMCEQNKPTIDLIRDVKHYKSNILRYWKYKILQNFVFGKTRQRYTAKKHIFKAKIRNAEAIT